MQASYTWSDSKGFNADPHDWWQTLEVGPGESFIPDGYIAPRRWMLRLGLVS